MTAQQEAILQQLVDLARAVQPVAGDSFVAIRIGLTGVTVFHPRAEPLRVIAMDDIDQLAAFGLLDLQRMPSGARVFQITRLGYDAIASSLTN